MKSRTELYLSNNVRWNKISLQQVSAASYAGRAVCGGRKEGHFILEAPLLDVIVQSRARFHRRYLMNARTLFRSCHIYAERCLFLNIFFRYTRTDKARPLEKSHGKDERKCGN